MKIRGTAQHVAEKYLQLARDAQSSGDIVQAENLLQHAEHYFRLIAAAQQQQTNGYGRQSLEAEIEEEDDDDFAGLPDRFAPLSERLPAPAYSPQAYQAPQPPTPQHFAPQPQPQPQPQPFEERPISEAPRHERSNRPQYGGRNRGYDRGADRNGEGQGEQGGRQPRFGYDRNRDRNSFQPRRDQPPSEAPTLSAEPPGLPAFITAPTVAVAAPRSAPLDLATPQRLETRPGEEQEGVDFQLTARRRRRNREDREGGDAPAPSEAPTTE